ncbi:DNA mismatch repair protein [Candidatus Saccharibacteria bacterium oral taxon 488]|nr:DNA mismatch repair protein [Candidatus Saccharibacteria bacterium oral taxon 488]
MNDEKDSQFTFNISLAVLNSLGRNLYRNFITILGEAISNSWDADADNVKIIINREKSEMLVIDDGDGMSASDFSGKFLRIGYSKRANGSNSRKGRPYIGRKGIGKLALLSCANRVIIVTKKSGDSVTGGVIDNSKLDEAIQDDRDHESYKLEGLSDEDIKLLDEIDHGTVIKFINLKGGIANTLENIRKAIALYFRFSLVDKSFKIYVDGNEIDLGDIKDLTDRTQFLWSINKNGQDPFIYTLSALAIRTENINIAKNISGFIASVEKPKDLNILGTGEKVGIDLFVNGRLRERDILKHIQSARVPESYLYGQIHYDDLDGDEIDRFTSSREGIVSDDTLFLELLENIKPTIKSIIDQWDKWRIEIKQDGDDDNRRFSRKERASKKLYNETANEYKPDLSDISEPATRVRKWINELEGDATFNLQSYTECFISENLVRKLIKHKAITLEGDERRKKDARNQIQQYRESEETGKIKGNLVIDIRESNDDLFYLDLEGLASIADPPRNGYQGSILNDEKTFTPIRNALMHTSRLTLDAKSRLTTVYANIKAKIKNLLSN